MRLDWRDIAIRVAFCAAGIAAAVIFVMRGEAEALPPLALGGAVGALLVTGSTRKER